MTKEEYKNYVKPELYDEFVEACKKNSLDFYSCGCILTAHLVLEGLMQHKIKNYSPVKDTEKKLTPKEAWESAMNQTRYHSGYSAAMTATMIAHFSPRGPEFKKWCIKDDVVMVNWDGKKQ